MMLEAFTDYPIESYGDESNKLAPIRKCLILTWDRNKYCDVLVYQVDEDGDLRGTVVNFKQFYIYKNEARLDDGIQFTNEELKTLPWTVVSYPSGI
jgi:hypothetical protein